MVPNYDDEATIDLRGQQIPGLNSPENVHDEPTIDIRPVSGITDSSDSLELPSASSHLGEALVNVAAHLPRMAKIQPHRRAVVFPSGRDKEGRVLYAHMTFDQLNRDSDLLAHGLEKAGIRRGTKTILMVRPSLEFFSLTFALFKVGAVPVMVDPGMGLKRMLHCFQETAPEGFVGIPLAHVVRKLFPRYFKSVKSFVTVGKRLFWGGTTIKDMRAAPYTPYKMAPTQDEELAAILFTTGSTGPAKGVMYEHQVFNTQVQHLRDRFGIKPGEIYLPTFPLFALFSPALGMTAIIPDMDPTKPAEVDPAKIVEAIDDHGVTTMFGSPALVIRVGRYCQEQGITLPSMQRVLCAGAPVPYATLSLFSQLLPARGEIVTPYGATEALPVAAIGSKEILARTSERTRRGEGICVGRAVDNLTLRIIRITDEPIVTWSDNLRMNQGQIGEIVVKGPNVTKRYYNRPEADTKAKIQDGGQIWHRMGDVGWIDEQGRLWFCGRKAHRVITAEGTLFTVKCEAIFNEHPRVYRSALVGVGAKPNQTPVIIIELEAGDKGKHKAALIEELKEMAKLHNHTRSIETFLFHPSFPVDIRHQAKIFREKLSVWAAQRLKIKTPA